jgi:hypothetical protein
VERQRVKHRSNAEFVLRFDNSKARHWPSNLPAQDARRNDLTRTQASGSIPLPFLDRLTGPSFYSLASSFLLPLAFGQRHLSHGRRHATTVRTSLRPSLGIFDRAHTLFIPSSSSYAHAHLLRFPPTVPFPITASFIQPYELGQGRQQDVPHAYKPSHRLYVERHIRQ